MSAAMTTKVAPFAAVMMSVVMATAQSKPQEKLAVQGYPGEAAVVQIQGRAFVDVQDLARITNGSLRFDKQRIILTLASTEGSQPAAGNPDPSAFSRPFMIRAVEAMGAMREWGGMLLICVQNGYPVQNNIAGNTITAYQGRAGDSVAFAAAAASTDADRRGLELLQSEFNNVQAWSNNYVQARTNMSAANLTMGENALGDDQEAQKILRCGQFLAQMFASGTFQDDASCR